MSDDRLNRIEDKVDKIHDSIKSIDSTLAAQHISLQEHIRRTELLETEVKPITQHISLQEHIRRTELLETEVKPIKAHVEFMNAVAKIITVVCAGVGVAVALKSLVG